MEAMERRGKLAAIAAIMFIVFWSQCRGVEGQRNNTKMSYVCPPQFIRLGHSCYYFSENKATWQAALFACTSHLMVT
uniref:SFRICE_028840 n=1 Tax=Spodoptera frugiperda TaxID=7108 RepID=A0A2H1VNV4_SPOFR